MRGKYIKVEREVCFTLKCYTDKSIIIITIIIITIIITHYNKITYCPQLTLERVCLMPQCLDLCHQEIRDNQGDLRLHHQRHRTRFLKRKKKIVRLSVLWAIFDSSCQYFIQAVQRKTILFDLLTCPLNHIQTLNLDPSRHLMLGVA